MDSERILHAAYQANIQLHAEHQCGWYTSVLKWLNHHKIQIKESIEVETIIKAAKGVYIQNLKDGTGTKHIHYIGIKDADRYEAEAYLVLLEIFYDRQILAQMRTGSNFLQIELGRRSKTPQNERMCTCCNTNEVEDEHHFVFKCEAFKDIRTRYHELFSSKPQSLAEFFMGDLRKAAKFLTECRDHRTMILH
jgi:hypothetical protein